MFNINPIINPSIDFLVEYLETNRTSHLKLVPDLYKAMNPGAPALTRAELENLAHYILTYETTVKELADHYSKIDLRPRWKKILHVK